MDVTRALNYADVMLQVLTVAMDSTFDYLTLVGDQGKKKQMTDLIAKVEGLCEEYTEKHTVVVAWEDGRDAKPNNVQHRCINFAHHTSELQRVQIRTVE